MRYWRRVGFLIMRTQLLGYLRHFTRHSVCDVDVYSALQHCISGRSGVLTKTVLRKCSRQAL